MSAQLAVPAYVLTLKSPEDPGLQALLQALAEAGLAAVPVAGVPGAAMPSTMYYAEMCRTLGRHGYVMSPAELGCALGHRAIYARIAGGAAPYAFVFEDDALVDGLGAQLGTVKAVMARGDVDYLHLGAVDRMTSRWNVIGRRDRTYPALCAVAHFSLPHLYSNCAYIVTRPAAEAIGRALDAGVFRADDYLIIAPLLPTGGMHCFPCVRHPDDNARSSIEHEREVRVRFLAAGGSLMESGGLRRVIRRRWNRALIRFLPGHLRFTRVFG